LEGAVTRLFRVTARPSLSVALPARVWRLLALAVAIAGALAIVGTYFTFSNTFDEPTHLAAGMQRLTTGRYDYDVQRPPLGRIAAAVGPYLRGERSVGASSAYDEGARLLGRGAHYRSTLALARLGELPFFLLLCGVVWAWGRQLTDDRGGAIAVLLVASNPNLLAHAGLATTDIALAATIAASLFVFTLWLDAPRWPTSVALGVTVALAATTDYASLAMLALAFPSVYLARRRTTGGAPIWPDRAAWRAPLAIGIVFVSAVLCGWAVYGFDRGPLIEGSRFVLLAPEWFRGFASYVTTSAPSPPAFLLGERSAGGWWYYFPIALLVKTPLPLLLLAILGAAAAVRDLVRRVSWQLAAPLAATAAIILAVAIEGDDSGVRLVLPVFALLAVLGTAAAVELWDHSAARVPARRLLRGAVAATFAAAAVIPMRAHPDYLAYFNPIAGDRPELILVDSNLDWGQDLYRLGMVMKRMRIDSVSVAYYGSASFDAAGVRNARQLAAAERPTGWIAASQTMLAGVGGDGAYEWLNELQPVGRVGSSLVLYYVPPRRRR
jgi:4-amino-4-deoxy-L-arabinose transferase-like glycosyltransferase